MVGDSSFYRKVMDMPTSSRFKSRGGAVTQVSITGKRELLLPVSSITTNPDQPRKHFSKAGLLKLGRNIAALGLLKPISVVRFLGDPNHDWLLVDGERRFRSHFLVGLTEIRALEGSQSTGDEIFTASVAMNQCREGHTPFEIALAIKKFREMNPPKAISEIATIFGRSEVKLHPDVAVMMEPNDDDEARLKFPIALLLTSVPHNLQLKIAKGIAKSGLSVIQARHLIRKTMHDAGKPMKNSSNQPARQFGAFVILVERLNETLSTFVDSPGKTFFQAIEKQDIDNLRSLSTELEQSLEYLEQLRELVDSILELKKPKNPQRRKSMA